MWEVWCAADHPYTSWAGQADLEHGPGYHAEFIAGRCTSRRTWMGLRIGRRSPRCRGCRRPAGHSQIRERMQAQPHTPEFLVKQAVVGRMGKGAPRAASLFDDQTNEDARPWEAAGVSRAWWYRKRQRQRVD